MDRELYKYDLGTGTTSLIKNINPNDMSLIDWMTVYNNNLYFTADDGTNGRELWMHDGTNTTMVADLAPGSGDSNPVQLTVWNGTLYFNAQNATTGFELFKYSSTVSGIENVGFNGSLEVFPNPVLSACRFKLELGQSQNLSIVITDGTGRQVYTSAAETYSRGITEIDIFLGHLSPGQYYYALYSENRRLQASGKLIKN
jgi:ELWxxDGT repeat protein